MSTKTYCYVTVHFTLDFVLSNSIQIDPPNRGNTPHEGKRQFVTSVHRTARTIRFSKSLIASTSSPAFNQL